MEAKITQINGNTVVATGLADPKIGNMVHMGPNNLYGEVISIIGENSTIQAYEDTVGLRINDAVVDLNTQLSIELGPGLLSNIFDGLGRRLSAIDDNFIRKGMPLISLDREKKWHFKPTKKAGDAVGEGDIIGEVEETSLISTKIMVPVGRAGKIASISEGEFTVNQEIAKIITSEDRQVVLTMLQVWPVRIARPFRKKLSTYEPLLTGQRIFDTLFPLHKGGSACIPGGFGTGKTVSEHQFAKFSNTDISIYIGCGERGNEMADVLNSFPSIKDPRSGKPIIEKMVLIANTSNMPIIAREASIFTGVTIAEYYRDMGYSVLLTADSTSRWAEALRQLGSELGEMPVEEGFPASLFSNLASFYSRAGVVSAIGSPDRSGSVTIIGAVSPPAGDFSEPVTQTTTRLIDTYWELDNRLSNVRHYPPVNWTDSYSLAADSLSEYYTKNVGPSFFVYSKQILDLLNESDRINEIASIIGREALPDRQAVVLRLSDVVKLYFLQQNAFDAEDTFTPIDVSYNIMSLLSRLITNVLSIIDGGTEYSELKKDGIWDDAQMLRHKADHDKLSKEIDSLPAKYGKK